jgi:amino acid adenylation domain-containing protein/non-ribosomal peptide synthase protein (TIGR01720 family)
MIAGQTDEAANALAAVGPDLGGGATSVPGWIAATAAASADAPAIRAGARVSSFGQLAAAAADVARRLRELGVRPEARVLVVGDRSAELVAAIIGVASAGAAFVPIEWDCPPLRLRTIVDDCRPAAIVTAAGVTSADLAAATVPEVEVAPASNWPSGGSPTLEVTAAPTSLAYVLYTSGSTGRPKGVMIQHGSLLNYVRWATSAYDARGGAGAPLHTSIAFDLTLTTLFCPLAAGRPLTIVPEDDGLEGLAEFLRSRPGFSFLKITPAHSYALAELLREDDLDGAARYVVIGGEALRRNVVRFWQSHAPSCVVVNEYGPTETVVGCTAFRIPRSNHEGDTSDVPIGRPITGMAAYVVDESMNRLPAGAVGELAIGGVGVGRGYLGDAETTAERFIPDPFDSEPAARLYRTGDRVRELPTGDLVYLGRLDNQIKIRGFRIELDEVAAVTSDHPGVRAAAAIVSGHQPQAARLVAYVVPETDRSADPAELRAWLTERVPRYMVPDDFVELSSLPLTPNGKVDRAELAQMGQSHRRSAGTPPQGTVEEALASIWTAVLGLNRVDREDNFFEIGGDSILGLRVVRRARRHGIGLAPADLVHHPTIAELAIAVSVDVADSPTGFGAAARAPLTPIMRWFFELDLPEPDHWNQAVVVEMREPVDTEAIGVCLEHVLSSYDAFRMRYSRTRDGWRCVLATDDVVVEISHLDLSPLPEEARSAAIADETAAAQQGLDLGRGPLARALLTTGATDGTARLLIVAHHLAVDAVSWQIILDDLVESYDAIAGGRGMAPAQPAADFAQWAAALDELASSGGGRAGLDHWKAVVSRPRIALPRDGDALASLDSLSELPTALAPASTSDLVAALRGNGVSIEHALLSVFVHALGEWCGSGTFVVDVEAHGRGDVIEGLDVSGSVGWFTALYPVALEVDADAALSTTARSTLASMRAVPAGGVTFGLLRYADAGSGLAEAETQRREILFNYLGRRTRNLSAEVGWTTATVPMRSSTSRTGTRPYLMELHAAIEDDVLQLDFVYSTSVHETTTIARLAGRTVGLLEEVGAGRHNPFAAPMEVPAAFPNAGLDADDLRRLTERLQSR